MEYEEWETPKKKIIMSINLIRLMTILKKEIRISRRSRVIIGADEIKKLTDEKLTIH